MLIVASDGILISFVIIYDSIRKCILDIDMMNDFMDVLCCSRDRRLKRRNTVLQKHSRNDLG